MTALIVTISLLYALGGALLLICVWSGDGDPLPPPQVNKEIG